MASPTILWALRGHTGTVTNCQLYELASGHFDIRIARAGVILFSERYTYEAEARQHARDYHESLLQKGWREAA